MTRRVHVGENELIVGERGPVPGVVPLYPEQMGSVDGLVPEGEPVYEADAGMAQSFDQAVGWWRDALARDGNKDQHIWQVGFGDDFPRLCHKGILARKAVIARALGAEDADPDSRQQARLRAELNAEDIACNGIMIFAVRHAQQADEMAEALERKGDDPERAAQLRHMADACRRVPAHSPCDFWEALQMYWFMHLGTMMERPQCEPVRVGELLDFLTPYYETDTKEGGMPGEFAKELVACFMVKAHTHGMLALPESADGELAARMLEVAGELSIE
jgi:formate C-acetyltransferase